MKAPFHQRLDPLLRGWSHDRRQAHIPLWCDFVVRGQTGHIGEALGLADRPFVESLASRISSFDKRAISETKRFADVASLPPDYEIAPEWDVCFASIMRPAAQKRIQQLMEWGFHKPSDVEERLGHYVAQLRR